MPISDKYGQGFTSLDYSDGPDLKVMGDGLLAMAGQTVMRFSSASARGATITAPVAGMLAWLATERQLTVYDGTDWITVAAGTTGWTNVPLTNSSGWGTYADDSRNNNQGIWQYRIVYMYGQKTIMFRGGIGRITTGSYTAPGVGWYELTATPLPTDARPDQLRTVVVPCSDINSDRITLKMDVRTDGHLRVYGVITGSTPPWIGFNGVFTCL